MRVKNSLNAQQFPVQVEVNTLPSLTVPDQTMSVREILIRYARGLPVGGARQPIFDETDDLPDIKTLDLTERQEYAEQFGNELQEIRKKAKRSQKKDSVKESKETDGDNESEPAL